MRLKLKNLIERIFTKRNIKIFLGVFMILGLFVGTSFAAGETTTTKTILQQFTELINIMLGMLSWIWIILAVLAGKLMTNDLVYGTFINMDRVLWNLWNIMKNFANFALGFYFIYAIVKNLFTGAFGEKSPMQNAIAIIRKTLIAGILVQMSRFLVGATIDVSTVATAAVSSLPAQFISSDATFRNNLGDLVEKGKPQHITVNLFDGTQSNENLFSGSEISSGEVTKLLDTILPSADSVVGPFMFLGTSIFDIVYLSSYKYNKDNLNGVKDLFMSLGVSGFVIFMFTIMLALIALFNLFRLLTLWVIIPMAPLIIILYFLNDGKSVGADFIKDVTDVKKIFTLIFKPVYMVLVLSIVLIVLSLVKGKVLNKTSTYTYNDSVIISQKEVADKKYDSEMELKGILNFNMEGLKYTIVDLVIYIFGLIMMFMLMKSCFSKNITGIKFVDERLNKLSNSIWGKDGEFGGLLGTMGVIPMGPKGERVGLGTISSAISGADDNALTRRVLGLDYRNEQDSRIKKYLGVDDNDFAVLSTGTFTSRDDWANKAVEIGRGLYKNNGGVEKFLADPNLNSALAARNRKNGGSQFIEPDNLRNIWNKDPAQRDSQKIEDKETPNPQTSQTVAPNGGS